MPVVAVNRRQDINMNTTKGKKQMQTKPDKKFLTARYSSRLWNVSQSM